MHAYYCDCTKNGLTAAVIIKQSLTLSSSTVTYPTLVLYHYNMAKKTSCRDLGTLVVLGEMNLCYCLVTNDWVCYRSDIEQQWRRSPQLSLQQSLDHLYCYMKAHSSVISCSASASLGRHLGAPTKSLPQRTDSTDLMRGSALILYNSIARSRYENELDDIIDSLHVLGLKVIFTC